MAHLSFAGHGNPSFPLYFNPNIFFQADPDDPSPEIPVQNVPIYILASVTNSGKQATSGATVKFWICNPSTVPTPAQISQPHGVSNVSLSPGETKTVLCVTPWRPEWVNDGHLCIVCEASASNDPAPAHPTTGWGWDINDRHNAQHNVNIIFSASFKGAVLTRMSAVGLHNNPLVTVSVREAPKDLFIPALRKFGVARRVNVTEGARSGILPNYVIGESAPKEYKTKFQWRGMKPNEGRAFHALVELPPERIEQTAAIFLVEQHDLKGKLVGGVAVIVLGGTPVQPLKLEKTAPSIPVSIPHRPYAADPGTGMMILDGIFVSVLGNQLINVETRNDKDSTLNDITIYVEGVADPAISTPIRIAGPVGGAVIGNASFKSVFQADFTNATPGETLVSFIVQQQSGSLTTSVRILKKIFILGLNFDKATKTFEIKVPQGSLFYHMKTVITPKPGQDCNGCGSVSKGCCCCGRTTDDGVDGTTKGKPVPVFPRSGTLLWVPSPPYSGTHGPLPFEDPLNKIPFAVIAAILSFLAFLAWLFKLLGDDDNGGGGNPPGPPEPGSGSGASGSIGGTFDESSGDVSCCSGAVSIISDDATVGALTSAAIAMWIVTIAQDGKDWHERGRDNTTPEPQELTVSEYVEFDIKPTDTATPGLPWKTGVTWNYERTTDSGRTLRYGAFDEVTNTHYLKSYRVSIDGTVSPTRHYTHIRKIPLVIGAQFVKPDGSLFKGSDLYAVAWLVSDRGSKLAIELRDDGYGYLAGFNEDGLLLPASSGLATVQSVLGKDVSLSSQQSSLSNSRGNWERGAVATVNSGAEYTKAPNPKANIGSYVGIGSSRLLYTPGLTTWYVFVLAQDVNTVLEGTEPREAAKTIGGLLLTTNYITGWNGKPCEMNYDAAVTIV
ncbi:hypothetical protein ABW20_dc0109518 [Dactylellina cionopaga]|nr:hypothetical protein ABW20_dc0109518 [Dactylellina cionopaga]